MKEKSRLISRDDGWLSCRGGRLGALWNM